MGTAILFLILGIFIGFGLFFLIGWFVSPPSPAASEFAREVAAAYRKQSTLNQMRDYKREQAP